jgi:hypothetical protein
MKTKAKEPHAEQRTQKSDTAGEPVQLEFTSSMQLYATNRIYRWHFRV